MKWVLQSFLTMFLVVVGGTFLAVLIMALAGYKP